MAPNSNDQPSQPGLGLRWNDGKPRAAILTGKVDALTQSIFTQAARERIARSFDLLPKFITPDDFNSGAVEVGELEVLFGTWGFPALNQAEVARFKKLRHIFYAAGSIKAFGRPFLLANIPISSAKAANSQVVADFCLGQILLAAKRYFQNIAQYRSFEQGKALIKSIHTFAERQGTPSIAGYRGSKVALIGCGYVSRRLLEHLRQRDFHVSVVDPHLSVEECNQLGVTRVTLERAFAESDIVSNHLPDLPALAGQIRREHFASMPKGSTFINTGRGAQVREDDLVEVFTDRTDLIALLDVTAPEPPEPNSKLYALPNVLLSSHIAGCVGEETQLLITEAIDSAEKWLRMEHLPNLESIEQFDLIA